MSNLSKAINMLDANGVGVFKDVLQTMEKRMQYDTDWKNVARYGVEAMLEQVREDRDESIDKIEKIMRDLQNEYAEAKKRVDSMRHASMNKIKSYV